MRGGERVVDPEVAELGERRRRTPDRSSPRPCGSGCSPGRGCRRASFAPRPRLSAFAPMQSSANATGPIARSARRRRRPASAILRVGRPSAGRNARAGSPCRPCSAISVMVGATPLDAGRVGDLAVLHRHVEVDAKEDGLPFTSADVEGAEVGIGTSLMQQAFALRRGRRRSERFQAAHLAALTHPANAKTTSTTRIRAIPSQALQARSPRSACPSPRRCPPCGWRSPTRCRTRTSPARTCRPSPWSGPCGTPSCAGRG